MSILALDMTLYWCGVYQDRVKEFERVRGYVPSEKEKNSIYDSILEEAANSSSCDNYDDCCDDDFDY